MTGQSNRSRLTAVFILFAVIAVLTAGALAPHIMVHQTRVNLETLQSDIKTIVLQARTTRAKLERKQSALTQGGYAGHLIAGPTTGMAGAQLQQRVLQIVGRHGGLASSIQVNPPKRRNDLQRISMTMVARLDLPGLRNVLADLEGGAPILFVDVLSVRISQTKTAQADNLKFDITLTVSGYSLMFNNNSENKGQST